MSAFAYVGQTDLYTQRLSVMIGDESGDARHVLQDGGQTVVTVMKGGDAASPELKATLTMTEAQARALCGALLRALDGGEDTRQLRRDYDDERKRVDRLIGFLCTPATLLPSFGEAVQL